MFYLLAILLFIVSYYVFVKLMSSILKGCLMAVFILVLFSVIYVFVLSAQSPVYIFDYYKIDNFEVIKL